MGYDDNDEPIVGVIAFAKSCSIENIEVVLDIAHMHTAMGKRSKAASITCEHKSDCFTA